jgi:DNA mismatch endonuclease (patch repair protein)
MAAIVSPMRAPLPLPPRPSSRTARAVMQGNSKKDTRPEQALRSDLHRRGLRFRKHDALLSGGRCRPDIVFRKARLAVFVDGCFWHGCPDHGTRPVTNSAYWSAKLDRNMERDREYDVLLERAGWRVVRVWEHEEVSTAADRVERALTGET